MTLKPMEKTSREYAEKLASEMYPTKMSGLHIGLDLNYQNREIAVSFYMKAVEETNVKGLLEALQFLIKSINPQDVTPHKQSMGIDLGEFYVAGASIPSNEAIHKAINEINKATK